MHTYAENSKKKGNPKMSLTINEMGLKKKVNLDNISFDKAFQILTRFAKTNGT